MSTFIPLGIAQNGAGVDPIARWALASLGLGDYFKAPADMMKSTIPVYRNIVDLENAIGEIKDVLTGKKSAIQTPTVKIIMPKGTYDFVKKTIPFNIEETPIKREKIVGKSKYKGKVIVKPAMIQTTPKSISKLNTAGLKAKIMGSPLAR
jgi:hypothetical protein